ncbi:MAG: M48 family metallopeptidase [Mycobacteriales bacterium]
MHCPGCRADLGELDPHWASWCESCEWGVDPTPVEDWSSPIDRWWQRRLNALSAREHARLLANGLSDGPSVDHRLVLALAAAVHLVSALVAVGVVLVLIGPVWGGFKVVLAIIGAGLVYVLLPRPRREEELGEPLSRQDAPELWSLVDEAARAVGTPSPDRIELVPWVKAAYGRVGWRRGRVLLLGYPLWAGLTRQGRVALLGHELGHEATGDLTRGLFVGGAVDALAEWRGLLRTPRLSTDGSAQGFLVIVARLLVVLLSPVLLLLLTLEVALDSLSSRAHQYYEHTSDDLGADLAGKQGALDVQQLLLGTDVLELATSVPLRSDPGADLWQAVEQHLASVPERERTRQPLLARRTLQSVDDEHPPTYRRLELLTARADSPARLVLDATRDEAIKAELQAHEPRVRRQLLDASWS